MCTLVIMVNPKLFKFISSSSWRCDPEAHLVLEKMIKKRGDIRMILGGAKDLVNQNDIQEGGNDAIDLTNRNDCKEGAV